MSNITLSIPQWSVGNNSVMLTLSGARTWANANALTQDPIFGNLFASDSNTIFLRGEAANVSTPGTLFLLVDNLGVSYPLNLTITPIPLTVTNSGVVFVGDSITNLPITFAPVASDAYG